MQLMSPVWMKSALHDQMMPFPLFYKKHCGYYRGRDVLDKIVEQNRESTEGCSKCKVRKNNDKFGKMIGLNK